MIGIIGAMQDEVAILLGAMEVQQTTLICGVEFKQGRIGTQQVVLTQCGVGKVNAAIACTILISSYQCDFIINTGIAGGIKGVQTRDIVIASELQYYDVDVSPFGYEFGQVPGMPTAFLPSDNMVLAIRNALKRLGHSYKEACIYSGDTFVNRLDTLKKVDTNKICIAEMEGAAIAHTCVKSGVNFVVLRFVSDIVEAESQIEDYITFEKDMAQKSALLCLDVLKNLE